MKKHFRSNLTTIIGSMLVLTIFLYIYVGLFFPDPYFFEGPASDGHRKFLLGMQILFPACFLISVAVVIIYRKKMIADSSLILAGLGIVGGILVCYPLLNILYFERRSSLNVTSFHPFLQLTPPSLDAYYSELPSDSRRVHIFALGGSTTEWKASSGQGWTDLLQDALNESFSSSSYPDEREYKKIIVHNVAREWYTSAHTLLNYQLNLRKHRPDVILVMHAINDLLVNADFSYLSFRAFRADYGHFYGPLSRLASPSQGIFSSFSDKISHSWYHSPRTVVNTSRFPGIDSFEKNLQSLIDMAKMDNITVVLMTQPYLVKHEMSQSEKEKLYMLNFEAVGPDKRWGIPTVLEGLQQYNDRVRHLAKRNDTILIDLEAMLPKTLDYFNDEVHYTDRSHPLIADYMAEALTSVPGLR